MPGEYHYGEKTEKKTAPELKIAAQRQPVLALTLGHPAGGIPRASDFIGTVTQRWNEDKQRVDAEFSFYDEVPDALREKIVSGWPVPISAGFTVDSVQDGVQKGIFYTHIAVLRDEDPKCPLNKCGVNVRMESSSPLDYRYEKAQSPAEAAPAEPKPKEPVTIEALQAQVAELRELIVGLRAIPPAVMKTEETKQPAEAPKEEPHAPEVPRVTPRKVIPAGEAKNPEQELKVDPITGMIILS